MQQPWRKRLLATEFISLAALLASMAWLSSEGEPARAANASAAWLLVPALASLGVFASFTGLMYLRWIASAESGHTFRNKLIFALLAATLSGVWIYAVAGTWMSLATGNT
jgi:hypothetical protein